MKRMKWNDKNELTNSNGFLSGRVKKYKSSWFSNKEWAGDIKIMGQFVVGEMFETEEEAKLNVELHMVNFIKNLTDSFKKIGK